jgi:hypothetical protein
MAAISLLVEEGLLNVSVLPEPTDNDLAVLEASARRLRPCLDVERDIYRYFLERGYIVQTSLQQLGPELDSMRALKAGRWW